MSTLTVTFPALPNNHNYPITGTKLRIWYHGCVGSTFIASDNVTAVMCGSQGGDWYADVPVTVSGNNVTPDPVVLITTDDSNTATVLASARFYVNGSGREFLFENWVITNTLGLVVNFAQLWIYNQQVTPSASLAPAYLTAPEVAALIDASALSNALAQDYEIGDYATFAAAVAAMPATGATLVINAPTTVPSNLTVPAYVTLRFTHKGTITLSNGVTLTITGPIQAGPHKIFYNALSGQGTVSFLGNQRVLALHPHWWGAVGDDSTDCTAAIQAAMDCLNTANLSVPILFPDGIYRIAGALQDTSFSNSQLVLPKRNKSQGMITVKLAGMSSSPQGWPTTSGVILRSTLASGNGAMIGVRSNWGSGTGSYIEQGQNGQTFITAVFENITLRLPANPTNSNTDLRFVHKSEIRNVRIDVDGLSTGPGAIIPDWLCTEPTTATSFGLKTMLAAMGNMCVVENVIIAGYYNGWRWGELVSANNVTFAALKVGIVFTGSSHASSARKLLFVTTAVLMKTIGADPFFTVPGSPTQNPVSLGQVDWEDSTALMPWAATVTQLDDAGNFLVGRIESSNTVVPFIKIGGANVVVTSLESPFTNRLPHTDITGGDIDIFGFGFAVNETYRGLVSTGGDHLALIAATTNQPNTANVVGIIAGVNDAIADGLDKRIAQIAILTDGAINSGKLSIFTMNAGVITEQAALDKYGNWRLAKFQGHVEGAALVITANTITPTQAAHAVGAGLLKNITLPPGPAIAYELKLLPTAAFTYDNTGNIAGTGGTAVIGRMMIATWFPSVSKWAMSY